MNDEEFQKTLERLNAIEGDAARWEPTESRKEHEDHFGDMIGIGEIYFKRSYGGAFDAVIRISRSSMERMLFALFAGAAHAKRVADTLVEREEENLREAVERLERFRQEKRDAANPQDES